MCHEVNCDGTVCGRAFRTRAALQQHRTRAAGGTHDTVHLASFVMTNQCPWCASVFASRAPAMQHVRGAFASGTCSPDWGFLQTEVIDFDSVQCLLCEECFEGAEACSHPSSWPRPGGRLRRDRPGAPRGHLQGGGRADALQAHPRHPPE